MIAIVFIRSIVDLSAKIDAIAKTKNKTPPMVNGLNFIINPETTVPIPAINRTKIVG